MRNEVDAREQVSALAACRDPFLIGVRHHSPALAASIPAMLDDFAPDVLAIELPAEADEWIPWLTSANTVAPVALAFSRGEDLSFYPFADFSPELAALRWAAARGVRVLCIDRPIAARGEKTSAGVGPRAGETPSGETPTGPRAGETPAGAADHEMEFGALREESDPREEAKGSQGPAPASGDSRGRRALEAAARAEDGDSAESWDRLVEARAPSSTPGQIRVAALAHGWAMRVDEAETDEDSLEREQWMRATLTPEISSGTRVAALVGAFHAPALLPLPQDTASCTPVAVNIPLGEHGSSEAAKLPARTQHAPVRSCLVAYSFDHLDSRSGYPSGIRDPGWQQLVYESGLDPKRLRADVASVITSITRALREAGHPAGPAEAAECSRIALDLATLRNLAAPSRRELVEAVTSVLAQGEILGRGRAVADALERVLIGTRTGRVDPAVPTSPLLEAVRSEVEAARLPLDGTHELVLVPERSALDLTRSVLMHRLRAGGVVYGHSEERSTTRGAQALAQTWQVQWTPATEASIELASIRGLTVEQIASTALLTRRVEGAVDVVRLLREASACACPAPLERALNLATRMTATVSFAEAVSFAIALSDVARADIPGAALLDSQLRERAATAADLFGTAAIREIRGIEGSDDPDDAAALAALIGIGADHPLSLHAALNRLTSAGSPLMQGASAGLLIDEDEAAVRIASWLNAATPEARRVLRRRLVGLLITAGARFDTAPAALALVDRINTVDDAEFVTVLPALRGGFDCFDQDSRERLLADLAPNLGRARNLELPAEQVIAITQADTGARARLAALGLADASFSPAERWRLILGTQRTSLSPQGRRMASALDELYGRSASDALDARRRDAASGPSQLGVRQWESEIDALFGHGHIEEIFGEAASRGRADLLERLSPDTVRPSVDLLTTALSLTGALPEARLAKLRPLVARLVSELAKELAVRLRPALTGLATSRPTRRHTNDLDLARTLRANLRHVVPVDGSPRVVPVHPVFHSAQAQESDWRLILVVDVSGSMSESVVYSALVAAILAESPCLSVDFLAFNTEIIDFSGRVDDPLALLVEVEIGGGTDIAGALRVARSRVRVPGRTLLVLVSDFDEGGPLDALEDEVEALAVSGVMLLGCAALNDSGTGVYNVGVASRVAAAGMRVAAVSPLDLARWVGTVIREHS
ncbi:DUF5682 family protein [Actinomyces mediterranea]|uniref:DUF5682 family protein n=1 Tax=Actinomyces mediterranea TaxID=1871028 RepID=UPI00097036CB|nr:DUF5682 family protein [Actinomyces mediterranea]